MTQSSKKRRICVGAFAGAHGVKGDARIKTFTQSPEGVASYGVVETEDGTRKFTLTLIKTIKDGFVLVRAPEIKSREDAEALKGQRLYVSRDKLPEPDEDEFYLDDLVGLNALDESGAPMGVVKAVYNFGADDLLELGDIPDVKGVRLVPFTKENVPEVDIKGGKIVVIKLAISSGPEDSTKPDIDR